MMSVPDSFPYFKIHENEDGYQVALQKAMYGHYVVVLKDYEELGKYKAVNAGDKSLFELYKIIFKWLQYKPSDVEHKCEILNDESMLHINLLRLPQST